MTTALTSRFTLWLALVATTPFAACLEPLDGTTGRVSADELRDSLTANPWTWSYVTAAACNWSETTWRLDVDGTAVRTHSSAKYDDDRYSNCYTDTTVTEGTYEIGEDHEVLITLPGETYRWQAAVIALAPQGDDSASRNALVTRAFLSDPADPLRYETQYEHRATGYVVREFNQTLRFEAPLQEGTCRVSIDGEPSQDCTIGPTGDEDWMIVRTSSEWNGVVGLYRASAPALMVPQYYQPYDDNGWMDPVLPSGGS